MVVLAVDESALTFKTPPSHDAMALGAFAERLMPWLSRLAFALFKLEGTLAERLGGSRFDEDGDCSVPDGPNPN
jgi:hypothetical protein